VLREGRIRRMSFSSWARRTRLSVDAKAIGTIVTFGHGLRATAVQGGHGAPADLRSAFLRLLCVQRPRRPSDIPGLTTRVISRHAGVQTNKTKHIGWPPEL
jgi:hypothetical protein